MNYLKKYIIPIILLIILSSCGDCEPDGYGCDKSDNSIIKIENEIYNFIDEDIRTTNIYENDTIINVNYSISRKGNLTGSNNNIGFGFNIKFDIKKINDDFIFNEGSVEFIKDNVWGDFYHFDSQSLDMIEYKSSECDKESGNSQLRPEKFVLDFHGIISNETDQKEIKFEINYNTEKVETCSI